MKYILPLILLVLFAGKINAQLKIDSAYALTINDTVFNESMFSNLLVETNTIGIKEKASGKICAIISADWVFMIQGNIFHDTKRADIKIHLSILKPKDKIFIEKIKLGDGCFTPPKQIAITVY